MEELSGECQETCLPGTSHASSKFSEFIVSCLITCFCWGVFFPPAVNISSKGESLHFVACVSLPVVILISLLVGKLIILKCNPSKKLHSTSEGFDSNYN